MSDELRRVSVHEAGLCVAGYLLFGARRAGPATILPVAAAAGMSEPGKLPVPPPSHLERLDLEGGPGRPLPLLPAYLRRWFEVTVMVAMAGDVATEVLGVGPLAWDIWSSPVMSSPAPKLAGAVSDVASTAELMCLLDGSVPWPAFATAEGLYVERSVSVAHARYLEAEVRCRVLGPGRPRRMITSLAAELAAAGTLPPRAWRAILAAVE